MSQISIVHAVLSLYANITVNGDQKAITQIVSSPFQVPKADIQSISDGLSRSRHRFSSRKWRLLKKINLAHFGSGYIPYDDGSAYKHCPAPHACWTAKKLAEKGFGLGKGSRKGLSCSVVSLWQMRRLTVPARQDGSITQPYLNIASTNPRLIAFMNQVAELF